MSFQSTAAHQCPDIELISLGRVMPHRSDSDYKPPIIGDVATYRCVQGYGVVGDVTRTCVLTINGTAEWNGTEPHCKSKPLLFNVEEYI